MAITNLQLKSILDKEILRIQDDIKNNQPISCNHLICADCLKINDERAKLIEKLIAQLTYLNELSNRF